MEKPFDFKKKLLEVHKPSRICKEKFESFQGIRVTDGWKIIMPADASAVVQNVALDLQEYFKISMECTVTIESGDDGSDNVIRLVIDSDLPERTFRIQAGDGIKISGSNDRFLAQGCYALEDEMNINEAPAIAPCDKQMKARFSPRMTESPVCHNYYTDEMFRMIAHSGMDSIEVGVGKVLDDEKNCAEVNDIIERAAEFGLDTFAFSPFKNPYHPDDEGAYEYYENTYGRLFEICPGLKSFIIVGESCEFPSKDERTTGKPWRESLKDKKSSPGWFPCRDYPQFVGMLNDIIKKHSKNAELVFWSYNWGYEKLELRKELIRNLPKDIVMMATFEMFEEIQISPQIQEFTTDYTLWQIGPGKYFSSEAALAKECDIPMYCMSNTGGNTWDIGGVPFLPAPQRWIERWKAVADAQDNLRLDGVREAHNYGFWPSIMPELAKYAYMTPMPDLNQLLEKLVIRDYGKENAAEVLEIFDLFSQGMSHCVSTNEDQFGPARVGPSYPLFFKNWELIPVGPESCRAINFEAYPIYTYNLDRVEKLQYETEEYREMTRLFDEGVRRLNVVISKMSGRKAEDAMEVLQIAKYIANNARTILHVKRWHYLKGQLGIYVDAEPTWVGGRKNMVDAKKAEIPLVPAKNPKPIVYELIEILKAEIANAEATIPLVEANSRLGFNLEYDYSCAPEQLRWKIDWAYKTLNEELLPLLQDLK